MARDPRERATLMVLERVGRIAVRATDHAVEAGVATRRAGVFGLEPVSGAPRNVPAGGGHLHRIAERNDACVGDKHVQLSEAIDDAPTTAGDA